MSDILIYLVGNWCCIGASLIVLRHYLRISRNCPLKHTNNSDHDMMISADLGKMLCIGAYVRCYWSLCPPPIWSDEATWIQWIAAGDLVCSCICWTAVVIVSSKTTARYFDKSIGQETRMGPFGDAHEKPTTMQRMSNWAVLTGAAICVSFVASAVLPSLHTEGAWPLVDFMVVFNMVEDGFAMIPQVVLVVYAKNAGEIHPEAHHFIGLLCLGRLLRTMFWGWLLLHPESGHAIWTFVLPDLLHTLLMGDYLYHWLRKIKQERVDPLINRLSV